MSGWIGIFNAHLKPRFVSLISFLPFIWPFDDYKNFKDLLLKPLRVSRGLFILV
jgi:hypothetical protein